MSPARPIALLPRIVLLISTSIVSTLIAACGGGGSGSSTPPPSPLTLQPTSATIGAGTTQKFTASGGQGPYSYSVANGSGTIDSSGLFTGPSSAGTATVRVTDAAGSSSTASVTTNATLAMNAASITMTASSSQTFQFSGMGGAGAGYQYTLVSGTGSVTADGLYTVGNTPGKDTVQVRDAQGTTASGTVQVVRVRTNGVVNSMAASGSALYLAGSFSAVNPYLTSRMAVLDPSSGKPQLQCDLNTGFDAPVLEILLFNNALYVGGEFSSYKGLPAHGLAKLDATTCALDTTFTQSTGFAGTFTTDPSTQIVLPTYVTAVAASGSSLFVTGNFTSYRGLPANYLAKIDLQTGALDQNFTGATGADGPMDKLALSADSVYVAGNFSHYRGASVTRSALVKVDINSGALDPAFQVPLSLGDVTALLYSGTSLYVAAPLLQTARGTVIKLDPATGVQDSAFAAPSTQLGGRVYGMAASGKSIYVSGAFTADVNGGSQVNLIRVDAATGQPDSSFNQAPSLDVVTNSFAISDSSIYWVGGFRAPGSQSTPGILKLNATTGSTDPTFGLNPGFGGTPYTVAVGKSGVYVGGAMSGYGGAAASNVAKIDATSGIPDVAFAMAGGAEGPVYKVLISGSSLYLGGWFFRYGGAQCGLIAKADANTGLPDTTFMQGGGFNLNPYFLNTGNYSVGVNALVISGTSLYVGGHFTHYRDQIAGELAKIDANSGDLDTTFGQGQGFLPPASPVSHPPDSNVYALAVTQNGLYVAGNFQQYRGAAVGNLLKLDLASGAMDMAFASPFGVPSYTPANMALLASGSSLYVASSVALGGGLSSTGVSKLDATSGAVDATFSTNLALTSPGTGIAAVAVVNDLALSGSSLYVAGDFTRDLGANSPRPTNGLIKVDAATGDLDTTFSQPGGPDGPINSLLFEAGSLYVGGSFSTYRDMLATFSAELDPASGANRDVAAF